MFTVQVRSDDGKEILYTQDFTQLEEMQKFLNAVALQVKSNGEKKIEKKASEKRVDATIATITGQENKVSENILLNKEVSKVIRRRDGKETQVFTGMPSAEDLSKFRVKKRGFWGQTDPKNLLSYVYMIGGNKVTFSAFTATYLYRTVEGMALRAEEKEKCHKFGFSWPKKIVRETGQPWKKVFTLIKDNGSKLATEFAVMVKN